MGRALPRLMAGLGLEQITGEMWAPVGAAGYAEWMRLTLEMSRDSLVRGGGCTAADLDLLAGAAGEGWYQAPLAVSVRGRKTA